MVLAVLTALVWSFFYYLNQWTQTGQAVDYPELLATLVVGAIIGGVNAATGNVLSEQGLWVELATYGGVIVFFDMIFVKILPTSFKKYLKKQVLQDIHPT